MKSVWNQEATPPCPAQSLLLPLNCDTTGLKGTRTYTAVYRWIRARACTIVCVWPAGSSFLGNPGGYQHSLCARNTHGNKNSSGETKKSPLFLVPLLQLVFLPRCPALPHIPSTW